MNKWHGPDGEPTLADVQREFPAYECWRGASGLYYARKPGPPGQRQHRATAQGEDPRDLRDMIIRAQSREDEASQSTAGGLGW